MKKFKILFLLIIVFSLSACDSDDIFCLIPFFCADEEVREAVKTGDPGQCEKLSNPDDPNKELRRKNECFQEIAMDKNDSRVCKMIVGDESRWNNCFKAVAQGAGNHELCQEIKNNERMKRSCYVDVAVELGDTSLCLKGETKTNKNKCFTQIATNKKDSSICDEVEGDNFKENCIFDVAIETSDQRICHEMPWGSTRRRCVTNIAINKNDVNICFEQEGSKDEDSCLSSLATETGDASVCNEIDDEDSVRYCYEDVAKKNRDPKVCENIYNDEDINTCYKYVGIHTNDLGICDRIDGDSDSVSHERSDCYSKIAARKGEGEACNSINVMPEARRDCMVEASKKGSDSEFCRNLESGDDQFSCAFNVAKFKRDASHCGKVIASQGTREKCIHEVVRLNKNERVCENITDPGDKEKCLGSVRILSQ